MSSARGNESRSAERLDDYLSAHFGARCRCEGVQRLSGGWSRTTLLVRIADDAGAALPKELIVRAETKGGLLDTPLEQEYAVLEALQDTPVPVPKLYGFEPGPEPLGMPFILMEKVAGSVPSLWRSRDRQWIGQEPLRSRVAEQFVNALAAIHEIDWRARGLGLLGVPPSGTGYAGGQVAFWEDRYRRAKVEPAPVVEEALVWMKVNLPSCDELLLVDGDYRVGNMVIGDDGIRAVLDWELATIGDPIRDLGYTTLEYLGGKFLEKGHFACNGVMETDDLVEAYERRTQRRVDAQALRFWQVFGAFCLITIMQTGVREFLDGRNPDVRMAWGRYGCYALMDDIAQLAEF
jgi:aminoglycoside phosphotransferase (APT) family kinase protein